MIARHRRTPAWAALLLMVAACTESGPEAPSGAGSAAASGADDAASGADDVAIRALLDEVERTFESGDLDAAMAVFADDAVIVAQGTPDIVGVRDIRAMYADMLRQFDIEADLTTEEIEIFGDTAYERGSYSLKLALKEGGQVVTDVVNRHIHILKRQPDGSWKTWRMMVNSAEPAAGAP